MLDTSQLHVAVVDESVEAFETLLALLRPSGISCTHFTSAAQLLKDEACLAAHPVIVADTSSSATCGLRLAEELRSRGLELAIVVTTAQVSVSAAVEAMKAGAFDYLTKPFDPPDRLIASILHAHDYQKLRLEKIRLQNTLTNSKSGLIGSGAALRAVHDQITQVAPSLATVLVTGETGTGKELVARAVHEQSKRAGRKFVAVNCGAFSSGVLESELFGHAKGAFTGAVGPRHGLFQSASGGTLFLDEVGELELGMQGRLLRVIQEGLVRPVGSDREIPIDVRLITATNRDLAEQVSRGRFREDLFYRLNVFHIHLPPLRKRLDDLPELVTHLLAKHAVKLGRPAPEFERDFISRLEEFEWHGNVRQLENVLERAVLTGDEVLSPNCIQVEDTPSATRIRAAIKAAPPLSPGEDLSFDDDLGAEQLPPLKKAKADFEQRYLSRLLGAAHGNRTDAARIARLDPSNLRRLLKRYGLG